MGETNEQAAGQSGAGVRLRVASDDPLSEAKVYWLFKPLPPPKITLWGRLKMAGLAIVALFSSLTWYAFLVMTWALSVSLSAIMDLIRA